MILVVAALQLLLENSVRSVAVTKQNNSTPKEAHPTSTQPESRPCVHSSQVDLH